MSDALRIFVGYDPREHVAWEVCRHSLLKHASVPIVVTPMKQDNLRRMGLYRRAPREGALGSGLDWRDGKPFSTEFSFSRFLVPALMQFEGWALFVDCDFLFRSDVNELFDLKDSRYPLMCVHHNYQPEETRKMDGQKQEIYSRKNWSSLVLWNCAHPDNEDLTVDAINCKPGEWLHNFRWIPGNTLDLKIGKIPEEWNWLEGWSNGNINPKAVHFTRGGPWFDEWREVDYGDEWVKVCSEAVG